MTVIYGKIDKLIKDVKVTDCIDIGGTLYEVIKAKTNAHDDIVLTLSLIAVKSNQAKKPKASAMLIIPKTVMVTTLK